jgi:hypothetical protein
MDRIEAFLSIASILSGFGITVFMFRIQRELQVRERTRDVASWLAWADYLVLAAIMLSLIFVVLPLVSFPRTIDFLLAMAAGSCAAAAILLSAYPWAILYHYRLELGTKMEGPRQKGEPGERRIVIAAAIVAAMAFCTVIIWYLNP